MATQAVRRTIVPEAEPVPAITAWPISWSATFVGALAGLAVLALTGLIGIAIGAHELSQGEIARPLGFWSLLYTVAAAFFSFVVAGWVAGKINGDRRSETTSLHGAIAWVLGVPAIFVLLASGAGMYLGPWYGDLGRLSTPAYAAPELRRPAEAAPTAGRTVTTGAVTAPTPRARAEARAVRNAALGGLTALILGLAGSIIGGWMASGEPMSLRYRRQVESYPG
jgi:hypothetical protein